MAPDDRTMFLEELPAPVTRQLLRLLYARPNGPSLWTPLGYPEGFDIGRPTTPEDVAISGRLDDSRGARLHPCPRTGQ